MTQSRLALVTIGGQQVVVDLLGAVAPVTLMVTDNSDGTLSLTGPGVVDNGNGTLTITSSGVVDNGNGTLTLTS
jgi:Zn-dependent M28 family amino/carboxypeptidase